MENKNVLKDSLVIGFALFAVFFGAGNLVFPPQIGLVSGEHIIPAVIGLALSGILFPMLAVAAVGNMGDKIEDMTRHIHPNFHIVFLIAALPAGIFGTMPRCGGVAYEIGLLGIFPEFPPVSKWIFLIAFFAVSFLVASSKSTVMDIIGKFITPFLLLCLLIIVALTFVDPLGTPKGGIVDNAFTNAFLTGVNTGDVGTGIMVASIFVATIQAKGYGRGKEQKKMIFNIIVVAFIILFVVYGGLCYLGSTGTDLFAPDTDNTVLLVGLVRKLAGYGGIVILSLAIILACFTTAAGMIATMSDWVVMISKGKAPYKLSALIMTIVIMLIASTGVSFVLKLSGPIFMLLFPMFVVLTIMGICKKLIPNDGAWKGAALMAVIVGIYNAYDVANANGLISLRISTVDQLFMNIPLAEYGFAWLIPSILGGIVGAVIFKLMGKESVVDEIDQITA